jgi:hypothetical protein
VVEPLKPFQIDEKGNIRCGRGTLKTGKRKGEKCRGVIMARDRTVACHNCGEKYSLSELLEEVERLGYLARQTPKEKRRKEVEKTLIQKWAERELARFKLEEIVSPTEDRLTTVIETGNIRELLPCIPMVTESRKKDLSAPRELSLKQLKEGYSPVYTVLYNYSKEIVAYVVFLRRGIDGLRGEMYNADGTLEGSFMDTLSGIERIYIISSGPGNCEALILEKKEDYYVIYINLELPEGNRMDTAHFSFKGKYITHFFC